MLIYPAWPLEFSLIQTSIIQPEAITLPIQDFQLIAGAITKHKNTPAKRIMPKLFRDHQRQPINGFTHIGKPRRKIHLINSKPADHDTDLSNSSNGFKEAMSACGLISKLKPLAWV